MTDSKSFSVWAILSEDGRPSDRLNDLAREPESHEWACRVTWSTSTGRAVPCGIELQAPLGQPIGAEAWHRVKVAAVISHTREFSDLRLLMGMVLGEEDEQAPALEAISRSTRPKRNSLKPGHFEWVADVYNGEVRLGNPYPRKKVRAEGMRRLGSHVATDAAVRGWVREAQKRGLITQTARPSRSPKRRGGLT